MTSVKELAARFESQKTEGSLRPRRNESNTPTLGSSRATLEGTVDTVGTHDSLRVVPTGNSIAERRAGRLADDVELKPLTRSELSKTLDLGDSVSTLEPGLLPPSQPARFLSRPQLDTKEPSAVDSPTLKSTGISAPPAYSPEILPQPTPDPNDADSNSAPLKPTHSARDEIPHKPLPISDLFARTAAPLYLPELDDHLAHLPQFKFSHSAPRPFPPLGLLKDERLKDLMLNSRPTPLWRDWNSIGSTLVNLALSIMGSSAISTFYSLAGLYNAVQIFALILNTIVGNASGRWRSLFLGTIPNVLALNFGGKLLQSISFLCILTGICVGLLFWFYRLTNHWSPNVTPEGLISRNPSRGTHAVPFVSFVLTVLYLPLSTISVHAITWADDFWPVDNPYINGTQPQLPPLGPSSVFRDPLDFCWTTTMRRDEINWAPTAVVLGVFTLIFMTVWFPIRLASTIKKCLPIVEPYDALGQRRSSEELEMEYQRLLERDQSPLSFLYNEYRRKWGSFKALYLGVKLTSLLIVALISPDSCLTLSITKNYVSRDTLAVARQAILLAAMIAFLFVQSFAAPFIDPVSNASEWTSRMNFVLTSLLGLFVALKLPGQAFWDGWALYIVYIITYGLTVYFTVINWNWMHRVIKRLTRRIDFSIDIFSPRLDSSPDSKHLTQRIWQESWSILLLAAPQCRMPASQKLVFAEGSEALADEPAPPYLLDFGGSPAERHIENIKILREIGQLAYKRALATDQDNHQRIIDLRRKILRHLIGPDAFWCPGELHTNASAFFGNAWCISFPLTVIIRYDINGAVVAITNLDELEEFVRQNETRIVEKQREIRTALRCLDNEVVKWPYSHTEPVGNRWRWVGGRRYQAHRTTDYYQATLVIRRNGTLDWDGVSLASGFEVSLRYAKNLVLDGSIIGLNVGLELTPQLARFLLLNKVALDSRMSGYLSCIRSYRDHALQEAEAKLATLSYGFLDLLYASHIGPETVTRLLMENEADVRVRDLAVGFEDAFESMDERMRYAGQSAVAAWWFIFWDDFWRRNKSTVKPLETHSLDFDPQYPTSIAYNPLPRPALETFLKQRGLWSTTSSWYGNWWWLHTGFLNKIYFHLNWIAFAGSSKAIHIHLGTHSAALDPLEVDMHSRAASTVPPKDEQDADDSTVVKTSSGIRAGTNHSDSIMRTRRAYKWETLMRESPSAPLLSKGMHALRDHRWHFWHEEQKQTEEYWLSWRGKLVQWFGVSPLAHAHWGMEGLNVDVRLEKDQRRTRYTRLHNVH